MATSGGPRLEGIGRSSNNLVLNLDSTLAASYPGDPVTNIYGDISSSSNLRPSRTEYNTSAGWRSVAGVPMCPDPTIGRIYKHTSGSLTSTWSGNSYGYTLKDLTTDSGSTYILTCWVYVSEDSNLTYFPCSIEQASSTANVTNYPQYYEMDRKGTWQLIARKCVADAQVRFIPIYPQRVGVTDGSFSGFYLWGGASVVKADYVTPYVSSSRSTTDGFKDLSKNANDGNLINGPSTGVSSYRDGSIIYVGNMFAGDNATLSKSSNYLDFDGTNDFIELTSSAPTVKTVEVWFNPDVISGDQVLYGPEANGGDNWLALNGSGQVYFYGTESADTNNFSMSGGSVSAGNWYQSVATIDGATATIYLNGNQVASSTKSFTIGSWAGGADIGRRGVGGRYYDGKISLVRVYDKVLTAAEIKSNYNQFKGRFGL
jgi:hypothetical protein